MRGSSDWLKCLVATFVALVLIPSAVIAFFYYAVEGEWSIRIWDSVKEVLMGGVIMRTLIIIGVFMIALIFIDFIISHIRKS